MPENVLLAICRMVPMFGAFMASYVFRGLEQGMLRSLGIQQWNTYVLKSFSLVELNS